MNPYDIRPAMHNLLRVTVCISLLLRVLLIKKGS